MNAPIPEWRKNFPSAEVGNLDPRRHALIEASAGTGKTFAIEHLVLRLLMENPAWNPEEILLLSFTEKTAADLRARVRALLRLQATGRAPEEDPEKKPIAGWTAEERGRLQFLWMHADTLAVHTLHGFCQSSLRRDPLEGGALIRDEVAEDRALASEALETLLRGPWAHDAERLAKLRDALDIDGRDSWRDRLVDLSLKWHPWRGDTMEPARDSGATEPLEAEVAPSVREFLDALSLIHASTFPISDHRAAFPFTKAGRPKKNWEDDLRKDAFDKVFRFEEEQRRTATWPPRRVDAILDFFRKQYRSNSTAVTKGWESVLPNTASSLAEWKRLAAACTALRRLVENLDEARRLRKLGLLAEAARELRAELAREKLRRGVISYDDMPANLVNALRENPALAARIRRRYKACIVDEFQDTDPVQWEILERLCLRGVPGGPDADGAPPLPLFLVGDPKQAIYGFRGGDLGTYLKARATFRVMAVAGRAQGFGLDANFRSRRALIEAMNATFEHSAWFGRAASDPHDSAWRLAAESSDVTFVPARAGKEDSRTEPCVHLRDIALDLGLDATSDAGADAKGNAKVKKSDADRAVRQWIVTRIAESVARKERTPKDFAVLVRRNSEGEALERLLRARGIRCRARRRGGVFHGPAADALRLLLEWVGDAADPDAQARILLLPFARAGADDLPRGRPTRCPPLITRWALLAHAGRWPEFFDSVRREGGYHERLAARSPSEAERFGRLARILAEFAAVPGTSLRAVRDRFDALRRGEGDGEDGAASEGEEGAVTVMTLHMSKGLEFPVVFLAASGEGPSPAHYVLRGPRDESAGFRIALDKEDSAAKAEHLAEVLGENKRLFYVAFTRAKDALHIPLLPSSFKGAKPGPLGNFAAEALRAAAGDESTRALFRFDRDPVIPMSPVDEVREDATTVESAETSSEKSRELENRVADMMTNIITDTRDAFARKRRLASYSALARHAVRATEGRDESVTGDTEVILDEGGARARREEPPAEALSTDIRGNAPGTEATDVGITAEDLPPGADSGTALHAILEHTDFSSARDTENADAWLALPGRRELVEERLRREAVDPVCAPAAARAVWNALRAPLPDPAGGPEFRLADLASGDVRHEVEFLLDFGNLVNVGKSRGSGDAGLPEAVARRENFLWGFIDLVFRRDGRFYLLDWKSNLLPAYDDASVDRSMEEHRYDLQWKLYAVALHRWLAARVPGYSYADHFGGVHYLYLRGTTPNRFRGFAHRPTERQLREEFPADIARLLGADAEVAL